MPAILPVSGFTAAEQNRGKSIYYVMEENGNKK